MADLLPPAAPGAPDPLAYAGPSDAVQDAKLLVKLWLDRHLLLYADRYQKTKGDYSDMFVDRREVDAFLEGRLGADPERSRTLAAMAEMEASFRDLIRLKTARTAERGDWVPFEDFRAAFDIDDERLMDMVLAMLVVEVDPDFVRAFAHAWCDFTRRDVDIGFLIELTARDASERDRLGRFFLAADHPIFLLGAIEVQQAAQGQAPRPLMQRSVRLADRVVQFLCGGREPPPQVCGMRGGLFRKAMPLDAVIAPPDVGRAFVVSFRQVVSGGPGHNRLLVHGPEGAGKRTFCKAAAASHGRPLLVGDFEELFEETAAAPARMTAFFREARLQGAIPLLIGLDSLAAQGPVGGDRAVVLERVVKPFSGPLVFAAPRRVQELARAVPGLAEVAIPHPTPEAQRALWQRTLPESVTFAAGFGVDDIVLRYSLTGGSIERVALSLENAAREAGSLTPALVYPLIRDHLSHRLGSLAVPLARGSTWADLVAPEKTLTLLRELSSYVRHREKIVRQWGFGGGTGPGRGVPALFFGPPGTGKTLAAGIIATDLGMEVFQIDLSRVVDKYIGETEKNLARVFDEGSRAQAILLFDEADSLFAKRTSVQSSVDRYANLEVNYLLQRMEAYEGVCILTSNFPESIDEAFKRRIRFKVEFPFPTAEERERLWRCMIPREAPVAGDVSYPELAVAYEMSGAHIRNVVLRAAAIAADEKGVMDMDVFVRAANREYSEMGKLVRDEVEQW